MTTAPPRWGLAAVLVIYLTLATAYSLSIPIFETPDEDHHVAYVRWLAEGNALPVLDAANPGPWEQEGGQPPLYYAAGALVARVSGVAWEGLDLRYNPHANLGNPLQAGNKNRFVHGDDAEEPLRSGPLLVHLLRGFSLLLGAGIVYAAYRTGRLAFPGQAGLALAAAALTAFTPQFVFVSSAVTNDTLSIFVAAMTLWLLAQLCCGQTRPTMTWTQAGLLGVLLGMAALTKLNGLGLWVIAAAVLSFVVWRSGEARVMALRAAGVLVLATVAAGWWYMRNWQLYGDLTGLDVFLQIVGPRQRPLTWSGLDVELTGLRASLIGVFGWFNLALPAWVYRLWDGFVIAAVVGLVWQSRRLRRYGGPEVRYRVLVILIAWFAITLLAVLRWTMFTPGSQGRLLMPALMGANIVLLGGWNGWRPGRRLWRWAPPAAMLALSITSLLLIIAPAYRKPALIPFEQIPATARIEPLIVDGRLQLVGVERKPGTLRFGEPLDVTLYWQALEEAPYDASLFVRLLGPNNAAAGQIDTFPGWGTLPTSQWPVGPVIVDRYRLVPNTSEAPTLLKLDVGLYDYDTLIPYPTLLGNGGAPPVGIAAVRFLPDAAPVVVIPTPAVADFDDRIRLEGYRLGAAMAQSGDTLDLDLFWRALQPVSEDLHAFVHVLDDEGHRVSGYDVAPGDGWWPTSAWEPGQIVSGHFPVALPTDLPAGRYTLATGWYRLDTLTRLPRSDTSGADVDGSFSFGTLEVSAEP